MVRSLDGNRLVRVTRGSSSWAITLWLVLPVLPYLLTCSEPETESIEDSELAGFWVGSFHFLRDLITLLSFSLSGNSSTMPRSSLNESVETSGSNCHQ